MSQDFKVGDRVVCIQGKYHSHKSEDRLDLAGVKGIVTEVSPVIRWQPLDESKRKYSPSVKGWGISYGGLRLIKYDEYEVQWHEGATDGTG